MSYNLKENNNIVINIHKKSHMKFLKVTEDNFKNAKIKIIEPNNLNILNIKPTPYSDKKINKNKLNILNNHLNSELRSTSVNGNEEKNKNKSILFKDLVISENKNNFSNKELALIIKSAELNKKNKMKDEIKMICWNHNNTVINGQTVTIKSNINKLHVHSNSYKNERSKNEEQKHNKNVNNISNLIKKRFLCCLS